MKVACLVVAVLAVVVVAQFGMVEHEVHQIIAANRNISVEECVEKCDASFVLVDPHDELVNDDECDLQCRCHIHHTCF